jgi:TonB family protein
LVALALLLGAPNLADEQMRIEIPRPEVAAHRISRVNFIRTSGTGGFRGLRLRIEVDENGVVTSAQVTEGLKVLREAAMALARTWRYKPFERNGQAMPATFTDLVSILPPELPVIGKVPFPAVRNWASVKITLERTRCFGPCPVEGE